MNAPPAIEGIRGRLRRELARIPFHGGCALLDYPDYPNIGDHMIWMGTIFYFAPERGYRLTYCSSAAEFDERRMPEGAPILLQGGGNFGDLWPRHQEFRERVIARYHDRPIAILPQTIHFEDPRRLAQAARTLNAHPDLTIFVRDERSFETASAHFTGCRTILAPDMAFELAGRLRFSVAPPLRRRGLYLCRADLEQPKGVSPEYIGLGHLEMRDWATTRRSWQAVRWELSGRLAGLRATLRYAGALFENPVARYRERISERTWQRAFDLAPLHRTSWRLVHAGAWQVSRHPFVVTNRLHGHILCALLGVPHVLLPNAYFKNEAFYRAWTQGLPKCEFTTDPMRAHEFEAALTRTSDVI